MQLNMNMSTREQQTPQRTIPSELIEPPLLVEPAIDLGEDFERRSLLSRDTKRPRYSHKSLLGG